MKTVRRLLYLDILWSVVFVSLAFLGLFSFIDFVEELEDVGRNGYTLSRAALHTLLLLPGHFYELFPISVLIGTIYAMARLAQSSEFTILRTAGLGPGRALGLLALPGLCFAALTFVIGDYIAPQADREAVSVKTRGGGAVAIGGAGAWMKERLGSGADERAVSVNVQASLGTRELHQVRVFEFDADGRLRRQVTAARASITGEGSWRLHDATVVDWPTPDEVRAGLGVRQRHQDELLRPTTLDAGVVAAALVPAEDMSTLDLWNYTQHLSGQAQTTQQHEIAFWKKALYPLACVVMVALALPFAYLHARAGGVSFKVFGGIMLGISFVLLNNVAGHLGVLRDWTPWIAAAAPSLVYLLISMGAFAWLVRYR